ncbi:MULTISPECIES: helix-turn-helix domain-containing protein [Pseudomonas]|uniref:Helix-turn-helix transcriptional regulator n=1 Tax=Pseudomonas asiatica TaxID=2219225 RepID=A0ABU5L4D9_9PSED|nr:MULTISPECIES: helix-turn-helix transcriptional regulator [Pseudomonas]MDZ5741032.1 helix-turn-helix transcriptional regulator [Pseudomonas asiatica]MDZ5745933.1 helix-turn-helix transcriptional regulator [Pseudomonas asiatica]MDZ5750513.1 helix-turn-helix transcriptional regulator [Pseudomonas asiatica]MDZ5756395.1 helix-turn-helix transcriptional regulator [Pseudomonas asiatica]SNT41522.1 Helix-turn-helix [Pseudomonas sp. LAMO17WK12:I8]
MELNDAVGQALRNARLRNGFTQEDFGSISSRTYISSLERGMKAVTVNKLTLIADMMGVHPLSILAEGFLLQSGGSLDELFARVRAEISEEC